MLSLTPELLRSLLRILTFLWLSYLPDNKGLFCLLFLSPDLLWARQSQNLRLAVVLIRNCLGNSPMDWQQGQASQFGNPPRRWPRGLLLIQGPHSATSLSQIKQRIWCCNHTALETVNMSLFQYLISGSQPDTESLALLLTVPCP